MIFVTLHPKVVTSKVEARVVGLLLCLDSVRLRAK